MSISTIYDKPKSFPTALIYILGVLGVGLIVYFGGEVITNFDKLAGRSGLTVEVAYGDAEVSVNSKVVGNTPFQSDSIRPGTNKITIKSATRQYQTSIDFLSSNKGTVHVVGIIRDLGISDVFSSGQEFWFEKDKSQNILRIISEPSGATILIDGAEVGKTPFTSNSISEGSYDLKISYAGYETQTARISTKKGYTLNGSIKLFPYPITQKIEVFEGSNNLYNITLDNDVITSDTQSWVNAIIYWNQTRGIEIGSEGNNKNLVFDYYIDYKGNVYSQTGQLISSKGEFKLLKTAKRGAYLGRVSDGQGITKEAKDALQALTDQGISSMTGTGKTAKILETGTGWLRVRNAASTSGAELAKVDTGKEFSVIEEQTGWVKIKVSDTVQGWVSSSYVTVSQSQ